MKQVRFFPIRVDGKLIFEFDPIRLLIRIKVRDELTIIDLLNWQEYVPKRFRR